MRQKKVWDKLEERQEQVEQLTISVSNLKSEKDKLDPEVNQLENDKIERTAALKKLSDEVTTAKGEVNEQKATLKTLKDENCKVSIWKNIPPSPCIV